MRNKLLHQVKKEVKNRLQQSLHQAILINLPGEQQSVEIERLWDVEVKIPHRPAFKLLPTISITKVFDNTKGKLLILGGMGSGKTTTLLKIANDLLHRAENDPAQPIPVPLNLLSWQDDNQPITDWLIWELKSKYGLNTEISKKLLENHKILPLLDGLDELNLNCQDKCIQKINKLFEEDYQLPHLVVCSRIENYKSCQSRLKINGAVFLKSLNINQIQRYLQGARSRELWEDIKNVPHLLALAKTPLLLNIMTFAYEEISIRAWKNLHSFEESKSYLLNAYIRRMLTQDAKQKSYPQGKKPRPEKIRTWLIWFAQAIKKETADGINIDLWFGGFAAIRNMKLRFLLWQNGYIPWNYDRFLNYAVERYFLQKVDNRYWFIHGLLQDHFAKMPLN